jgi:UPF0271 protein
VRIELNGDVGEGDGGLAEGQDPLLIPLLSAVNVACGGHAGDRPSIARAIASAIEAGAAVGAHPGYPDREGFGRRHIDLPRAALEASLVVQIELLATEARSAGVTLRHVKAHGALYNEATHDAELAALVVRAIAAVDRRLAVVGPPESALTLAAQDAGLPVMTEGFADRAYEPNGSLRSRSLAGAVHVDPAMAADQALALVETGRYATLCIHGDTPGAPAIAAAVRSALEAAGHEVPGGAGRWAPGG